MRKVKRAGAIARSRVILLNLAKEGFDIYLIGTQSMITSSCNFYGNLRFARADEPLKMSETPTNLILYLSETSPLVYGSSLANIDESKIALCHVCYFYANRQVQNPPSPHFIVPWFNNNGKNMEKIEEAQKIRAKFYNSQSVVGYIKANGVPKSKRAFNEMVAAGTSEKLDTEKGLDIIDVLGYVVFSMHPQQTNVMDKSNGKTIASIRR
jgi:hypothetical protein